MATKRYCTSGRSWATRWGDQMSRLLISARWAPQARQASEAAIMPGEVSEFSIESTGPEPHEKGCQNSGYWTLAYSQLWYHQSPQVYRLVKGCAHLSKAWF